MVRQLYMFNFILEIWMKNVCVCVCVRARACASVSACSSDVVKLQVSIADYLDEIHNCT